MTYAKQTWQDGNGAYPLSAARMAVIEQGVYDAHYKPGCVVFRTTTFSVPNNAPTPVPFDNERFDTGGFHDNTTNPTRLTAPSSGVYLLWAHLRYPSAANERDTMIRMNGLTTITQNFHPGANIAMLIGMATWWMLAGDYAECIAYQSSGAATNLDVGAGYTPQFGIHLLSYM